VLMEPQLEQIAWSPVGRKIGFVATKNAPRPSASSRKQPLSRQRRRKRPPDLDLPIQEQAGTL